MLLSAEGHDHSRRARAYLVTDEDVRREAARRARTRPQLDELSASATAAPFDDEPDEVIDAEIIDNPADPETAPWTALREAPDEGLCVPELMMITGMGRTWIYDRLQSHAAADRAAQVSRGRWRATDPYRDRPAASSSASARTSAASRASAQYNVRTDDGRTFARTIPDRSIGAAAFPSGSPLIPTHDSPGMPRGGADRDPDAADERRHGTLMRTCGTKYLTAP